MRVFSHEEYPQLSPSWWEIRNSVPTASEFKRIITAKGARGSSGMAGYARQLINEMKLASAKYFTQKGQPINKHQAYGRDMESEARERYAFDYGVEVRRVGFVKTDDDRFGCSPDFLIVENGQFVGGGEIKCPSFEKHSGFQLNPEFLPLQYKAQVFGSLVVAGLNFWVWRSYYPDLTPVDVRVEENSFSKALRVQLEVFWELFQEMKKKEGIDQMPQPIQDPEGAQALADWKEFIASGPARERLNEELPKLSKAGTGKRDAWTAIKNYAASQKWVFDGKALVFKEEEPSVNF